MDDLLTLASNAAELENVKALIEQYVLIPRDIRIVHKHKSHHIVVGRVAGGFNDLLYTGYSYADCLRWILMTTQHVN